MSTQEAGTIAVLAEKPSVARDIASVLGANTKGDGYLHGNGYVVTWAIGHLAALAQPHEIDPAWRQWRRDLLPMLPAQWPLVVYDKTKDQFDVVRKIVQSPRVSRIVCATDAGREGELIFRYIYEAAHCDKPTSRLWISSLTPDAIRKGFAALRPGTDYDALADAARGRSRADWLVGMNLSRAYSLAFNENLSVGRVQTPTLAMLVERELAIRSFVPEDYLEVSATFQAPGGPPESRYVGTWFRPQAERVSGADKETLQKSMRLPPDGEEANRIADRARTGAAAIESVESETQRMAPPPLYDLTELQRHANRLYGFSAQKTLDTAQALYERHKLISYPRTDSRHLSQDVALTLPRIVAAIAAPYQQSLAPGTGERPLGKRFVDDTKVTDHHAIIPTVTPPEKANLDPDERKIYDLICRRLLSAWHADHIWSVTTVITAIRNAGVTDRYHTSGTAVEQPGWKVLDIVVKKPAPAKGKAGEEQKPEQALPPGLKSGDVQEVAGVEVLRKKTRAPKRLTEGTLLTAMETAGQTLDEKELSEAMKETGLGTPATRAAIIEVLLKREYIVRRGKSLEATDKGIRLIEIVHPEVKSPAMTGQWEAYLGRIQRGKAELAPFLKGIEDYVREVVGKAGNGPRPSTPAPPRPPQPSREQVPAPVQSRTLERATVHALESGQPWTLEPPPWPPQDRAGVRAPERDRLHAPATPPNRAQELPRANIRTAEPAPTAGLEPGETLPALLQRAFGFPSFRPNQEAVCQAAVDGKDCLLVMPTGSGKSLCYQLPGIARGGTTLVISPLIALMEDQVAKLKAYGFSVERIHSGRDRAASREACIHYLNGRLQFLFIAPERLRVAGFPEMLAKRKPSLIAIDEAHCISQWGHDFRPDYRTLGQHVPALRPAPVIALTATATPLVQDDIAHQLGLLAPSRFIHGFRRANIAIEVVEVVPSRRSDLACELLLDDGRRPGIVYTPTRKQAESVAAELGVHFPTAAYHAGLDADHRKRVQEEFLAGKVEVMVATIAFGMGIDKPDIRTVIHTALPGSLEAYYQEIGRAGRDSKPSRAVLMHSYGDRYTHDFFFERDYPPVAVLDKMFARLRPAPIEKEALQKQMRIDPELFDKALAKLWINGGAVLDYAENITIGTGPWRESYLALSEQKRQQIELMIRFAETNQCRMSTLVRHFGDLADGQTACGVCDFCAPAECEAQRFRSATAAEREALYRVIGELGLGDQVATGRLYTELYPAGEIDRDSFEDVLGAMARCGLAQLSDAVFEKDGKVIPYRKVKLTAAGRALDKSTPIDFIMKGAAAPARKKKKKVSAAPKKGKKKAAPSPGSSRVEEALRAWRLTEARRRGVPAFRIFSDKALQAIALTRPSTAAELLAVPGIGISAVEKYAHRIYRILEKDGA